MISSLHGLMGLLMWPSMSMVYNKLVEVQQANFDAMGLGIGEASQQRMTRAPEDAFSRGDIVELDDIRLTILELSEDGLPNKVTFAFKGDQPLPEMWACEKGRMTQLPRLDPGESTVIKFSPPL